MERHICSRLDALGFLVELREDTGLYDIYCFISRRPALGILVAKDLDEAQVHKFLEEREQTQIGRANV